jgi:cell division protein FtsW (lipid II flippase)
MEAVHTSKTSGKFYETTWHNILEGCHFHKKSPPQNMSLWKRFLFFLVLIMAQVFSVTIVYSSEVKHMQLHLIQIVILVLFFLVCISICRYNQHSVLSPHCHIFKPTVHRITVHMN